MRAINYILVIGLVWGLTACSKQELIPSEYVVWVNDEANGLLKKKTIHPLTVEALYKPLPYIIANEFRSNTISKVEYDKRVEELNGMQYYTLKLSITDKLNVTNYGVSNMSQQDERITYLSFAMKNDIQLVEGNDTLNCALYHFERSHDLNPHRTFVLAFEKTDKNNQQDKTLILDLAYFQTGPIKLNFKAADLEKLPNLKL